MALLHRDEIDRSPYHAAICAGAALAFVCLLIPAPRCVAASNNGFQPHAAVNEHNSALDPALAEDAAIAKGSCDAAHDSKAAEYCQQRRSADAAVEQAKWAFYQLLVGLIGVIAVILTLIYTAKAANAASNSAKAAEKAIEGGDAMLSHAERASERQLRAYVFPHSIDLLEGRNTNPPDKKFNNIPGFILQVRNSGQTPAYRVLSWAEMAVIDVHNEHTLIAPVPISAISSSFVPSGGFINKRRNFPRILTNAEQAAIAAGTHGIYVYGRVEYTDAFKQRRFTNFRFVYTGLWPPPKGATFTFCNDGNETDDKI